MRRCIFLMSIALLSNATDVTSPISNNTTASSDPEIIECVEDVSGKTRTFANFTEYQGNRFRFDPRHVDYQGNNVQFSFKNIDKIERNTFISLGSDNIMKLDLHGKSIRIIEPESFKGLFCLQQLDLSHNNLSNLTEGSFADLENLEHLNLSFNLLTDIPDNGLAFIALKVLKTLDLSHNQIKTLDRRAFMTLYDLEVLNLGFNDIKVINPKVFNYMESLQKLFLNDNDLLEVSADLWNGLQNLTDLDLSNNYLAIFNMSLKYSFVNLRNLNLSGNDIKDMNIYNIRKIFPKLENLDLSNNSWYCEDLEIIKRVLRDSRINLPRSIDCKDYESTTTKISTKSTTKKPVVSNRISTGIEAQVMQQNTRILKLTDHVLEEVESLRTILMCLVFLLVVFALVSFTLRMGICRSWFYSISGRSTRGYVQTRNSESVGLIPR